MEAAKLKSSLISRGCSLDPGQSEPHLASPTPVSSTRQAACVALVLLSREQNVTERNTTQNICEVSFVKLLLSNHVQLTKPS